MCSSDLTPDTTLDKGRFNVFPIDLTSLPDSEIDGIGTLGVVNTAPLKIELEFNTVPAIRWYMATTFLYLNEIQFTGSRTKQEPIVTYV